MDNKIICVSLGDNLMKKLKEFVDKKNVSKAAVIRIALSEYLERNK